MDAKSEFGDLLYDQLVKMAREWRQLWIHLPPEQMGAPACAMVVKKGFKWDEETGQWRFPEAMRNLCPEFFD